MSTLGRNLPATVNDGAGAWVDVSMIAPLRTITVDVGANFTGELFIDAACTSGSAPTDPSQFASVARFNSTKQRQITMLLACNFMRVRRVMSEGGPIPTVNVGGSPAGNAVFGTLPVTPNDGFGASVDVSLGGEILTIIGGGSFNRNVYIEGSLDGGSTFGRIDDFGSFGDVQARTVEGSFERLRTASEKSGGGDSPIIMFGSMSQSELGIANWPKNLCRYYFVSPAGNDDNLGFIDAVPGTVFTPTQTTPVAIRTLARLAEILPRWGNGRLVKILIAPGTYTDRLDIGQGGYPFIRFMGSDLTNSVQDNRNYGTEIDPACVGPDAGGAWTLSGRVGTRYTIASGTLPAIGSIVGRRVIWEGNVTPGVASRPAFIINRNSDTEFDADMSLGANPVNGDRFTIRRPTVLFPGFTGAPVYTGVGGFGNYSGSGPDPGLPQLAGFYLTSAVDYYEWPAGIFSMCCIRVAGGPVLGGYWDGFSAITFPFGFLSETGAFNSDRSGLWIDANLYAATAGGGLYFGSLVNTNPAAYIEFFNMISVGIYSGYITANINLNKCGKSGASTSGASICRVGNFNPADAAPVVIESAGSITSIGSNAVLGKLLSKKTTGNLFIANGSEGTLLLRDLLGTAGVVLDITAAKSLKVLVEVGNTIVPATGGIRLVGNELISLADLAGISLQDRGGNVVQGNTANIMAEVIPSRTDDPAMTPPVGHILMWFRNDTDRLFVKKSDGTVISVLLA